MIFEGKENEKTYDTENCEKMKVYGYMRVNKISQLGNWIEEKITDKKNKLVAGLYIRTSSGGDKSEEDLYKQKIFLEEFCKANNIKNVIEYFDIGKSGNSFDREAFKQMMRDAKSNKINMIIVTEASRIHRSPFQVCQFLAESHINKIKCISLDDSIDSMQYAKNIVLDIVSKTEESEDEETI